MSFDRWGRPEVKGYGMQRKIAEDVYKQWEAKQREKEEKGGNGNLFDFMLDRHDRNVDLWLKGLTVGLTVAASVLAAIINERR